MSSDIYRQIDITGSAVYSDESAWNLSPLTIKTLTNSKIRPARKAIVLSGSNQSSRGSNAEIGSLIKLLSAITYRSRLLVRHSLTRLILDSRALCGRKDRRRY